MTTKDQSQESAASRKRKGTASSERTSGDAPAANGGLTRMQALALWELIIKGDGTTATQRSVKLEWAEVKGLEGTGLVTVVPGRTKKGPANGAKLYVTDEGWAWANHQGLKARLSSSKVAVSVLEALLAKIGKYMEVRELALDHVLRPRRPEPEAEPVPKDTAATATQESAVPPPGKAESAALEERIRAAYLRVTGGALNKYVRLALLRAQLGDEPVEAVDAELRQMQQRGGAVLYPIDDPQRIRPEDNVAALRIAGERRDLLCITE